MVPSYALGIDIGGTNTVFGVVNNRGEILTSGAIKTAKYATAEEYVAVLIPELNDIIKEVGGKDKFKGIGIGAPNGNFYSGCIEDAPNLPWAKDKVIPFAKMITDGTGIPAALTNDANAAAIGEMSYGVAKGLKNFIMITLGTGVGSGVVVNGQLVYGHDGFAGELGHVTMRRNNGRMCGCGRRGCLEAYASATGMAQTARELLDLSIEPSSLRELDAASITSKDIYDAAIKGDKLALQVFSATGKMLGEAFADFIAFTSPEAIILFGGLAKAGDLILQPVQASLDANVMPIFKSKTKILFSHLKDADAAILGASALAWDIE